MRRIKARVIRNIGTESKWLEKNPVLGDGEMALVRFGGRVRQKIGNGSLRFSDLSYQDNDLKIPAIDTSFPFLSGEGPAPEGIYFAKESGTYQPGNVEVDTSGKMVMLVWDGVGELEKVETEMPDNPSKISEWAPATTYDEGEQVTFDGIIYRAKERTSEEVIHDDWEALGPSLGYYNEVGFIDKSYGFLATDSSYLDYRSSFYMVLKDRENLKVTGYSGVNNNVALVSFYDYDFKYLGFWNSSTSGIVTNEQVPVENIPNSTHYIRCTRHRTQTVYSISGVSLREANIPTVPFDKSRASYWSGYGHINKNNGEIDRSSVQSYVNTKFLKILDSRNIFIRIGYSGATSLVALVAFYDKDFNYLGHYNTDATGVVQNVVVSGDNIPTDAVYIKVTSASRNRSYIFGVSYDDVLGIEPLESFVNKVIEGPYTRSVAKGYIDKRTGVKTESGTYLVSNAYRIISRSSEDIVVTGFSGVNNNVALAAFYDQDFNYLGHYNTDTHGVVYNETIPVDDIPSGTSYIRVSLHSSQRSVFNIKGVEGKQINLVDFEVLQKKQLDDFSVTVFDIPQEKLYSEVGYINKTNGKLDASGPSYRSSLPLLITDRENLIVTGYSGVTNNAALVAFYDEHLNFIGFYNADHDGTIYNHHVLAENIPTLAKYVRFTRTSTQTIYFSGASTNYNTGDILSYVEDVRNAAPDISNINTKRSGRPNVDRGGHIKMLNYLGNDQNIHPKVLYFDTPWNGYRYWMAYTPYPSGNTEHENPCIAASNDGMTWETPDGLVNPLAYRLNGSNYNSDTHLLYRSDTDTLECWWREFQFQPVPAQDAIVRAVSSDGVNWGEKEYCFDYGDHTGNILSPAVVFEDNKYKLWCCNSGVKYSESTTGETGTWSEFVTLPIDMNGASAWHLDVQSTPFGREFIIQGIPPGGNNNTSDIYHSITKG